MVMIDILDGVDDDDDGDDNAYINAYGVCSIYS